MQSPPKGILDAVDGACREYLELDIFRQRVLRLTATDVRVARGLDMAGTPTVVLARSNLLHGSRQGHLLLHLFMLLVLLELGLLTDAQWAYRQQDWLARKLKVQEGDAHVRRRVWEELENLVALHGPLVL